MRLKRPSLANCTELFERIKFRIKFEVSLAEWNPKIDLLALGSTEGDVVVKRYLWKTGWKRNFSRENPLKQFEALIDGTTAVTEPTSADGAQSSSKSNNKQKDELLAFCWSPDGQMLLVAFASGRCLFLDTQTGNTLFIRKLGYMPMRISWMKCGDQKVQSDCFMPGHEEKPLTISSSNFNFREDISKEHATVCEHLEQFHAKSLPQSLAGTMLCVMHVEGGQNTVVDVLADGILLVWRISVEQCISGCLKSQISAYQCSTKAVFLKDSRLHIPFEIDDDIFAIHGDPITQGVLQFQTPISQQRVQIHGKIGECLGRISFCCLYLQEMLQYSAGNWQQASEAFHQRLFANASTHRNSISAGQSSTEKPTTTSSNPKEFVALEMCRDLVAVLEDSEANASELVEKFLNSPTAEKELKQAAKFVQDFGTLIKGINDGLLPATNSLRHAICSLRSDLINLCMNLEEEDDSLDADEILLDTFLKIAASHLAFSPTEILGHNCEQYLNDFEQSTVRLEQKLQTLLDVAEKNKKELDQLLHWLVALVFEAGNECSSVIDESQFDLKQLNKFLTEVTSPNNSFDAKCILDRVYRHLVESGTETENEIKQEPMEIEEANKDGQQNETEKKEAEQEQHSTVDQHVQQCFAHFRTFFQDGITKIVHSPSDGQKCCILSAGTKEEPSGESGHQSQTEDEEASSDDQNEDEPMEAEQQRANNEKLAGNDDDEQQLTLHAFIFGYDQPTAAEKGVEKQRK